MSLQPFLEPIYVTRPLLPNLEELNKSLVEIWQNQILTNKGPKHQELEIALGKRLKVPTISLFNNGMIALMTTCQTLQLSGEVITTPFTFPATPHALTLNQLTPVFCDIDPITMNIDASKIEALITKKTSAILGVHVYGTPCDVLEIEKIAHRHGLKVIYDAAHAFGVEIDGKGIGTFGDISMFSFHATKLFHTLEGGCLTFNDLTLKSQIELLKNFGIKNENEVVLAGTNGKLNEIQAAIGLINLRELEAERQRRATIINTYQEELLNIDGLTLLDFQPSICQSYQYFVIRINADKFGLSRDELYLQLKNYNLFTRKYFHPLCSNYACYKDLPSAHPSLLPVANQITQEVLALPLYGQLSIDNTRAICQLIRHHSRSKVYNLAYKSAL